MTNLNQSPEAPASRTQLTESGAFLSGTPKQLQMPVTH
jgi:hypothetical protein